MEYQAVLHKKDIKTILKELNKRYNLKKQAKSERKVDINMRLLNRQDDADEQVLSFENKPMKDAVKYADKLLQLYYGCCFDEYCVDDLFIIDAK